MTTQERISDPNNRRPAPVPLCLHCLHPFDPLRHYCRKCGSAVGHSTPYIPFVNIPYTCEFWSGLWQKLWSPEKGHLLVRILALPLILFFAPVMLLGLPFALYRRLRPAPRGFDRLAKVEQKLATLPPPTPRPS
ncbi:MAG: hypothetical protein ACTHN5_01990 [Phycisphaerae bacterium]